MKEKLKARLMSKAFLSIAQIVIAVLLLINPEVFTTGIIIAISLVILVRGVLDVIAYFRLAPVDAAKQQLLTKGLSQVLIGLFGVFKSSWFIGVFPLLAVLYGVVIVGVGVMRIQWAVDMFRVNNALWKYMAIDALVSFVMGMIIVLNPFATTEVLWSFVAITLLINAVLDMLNVVFDIRR